MELGRERRYVVERLLGEGTFGRVLACTDKTSGTKVAVKVVKGVRRYCEHAEAEAEVLSEILKLDPERQGHCVDLRDTFLHDKLNYCIVFEPLDTSIRDFLKANHSRGLLVADVREISHQLIKSLAFLHAIGVTHTDLKCRNVMLRSGAHDVVPFPRPADGEEAPTTRRLRDSRIVVIDFGGAVFEDERHDGRIGTRQFRAPEVVLGLDWDETSDLWSAACIIAMLYLGERPFSVHEDMEHLALMEKALGVPVPPAMALEAVKLDRAPAGVQFDKVGRLCWPESAPDSEAVERVRELPALRSRICERHTVFYDSLLQGLFEPDPAKRLRAAAALRSDFLTGGALPE